MKEKHQPKATFSERVLEGLKKSFHKLVKETAERNGLLVIERNGKIVHVPAKEILLEMQNKK